MRTGRPRTRTVVLTPQEQRQLTTWTRAQGIPPVLALRSRVLLLVAAAEPITRIAARVGLSRQGIYLCLRRFQQAGLAGLPRYIGGRPQGARENHGGHVGRPLGRPRTVTLVLTPDEEQQLRRLARAQAIPYRLARGSRALLLVAVGMSVTEVAERVGLSRRQVYAWLTRFQQDGLAGLTAHRHAVQKE